MSLLYGQPLGTDRAIPLESFDPSNFDAPIQYGPVDDFGGHDEDLIRTTMPVPAPGDPDNFKDAIEAAPAAGAAPAAPPLTIVGAVSAVITELLRAFPVTDEGYNLLERLQRRPGAIGEAAGEISALDDLLAPPRPGAFYLPDPP